MTYKYDKAIIIGCDHKQEDILFWFIRNFRKHSPNIPVQVVDFGLNEPTLISLKSHVNEILTISPHQNKKTWFNKPRAMLATKAKKTLWLDIDMEIVKDISDIFDLSRPNELGLVQDQYYQSVGKAQYNTGLVLFENKPKLLFEWDGMIDKSLERGDQEVLKEYLENTPDAHRRTFSIPDKYNVVRLFYQVHASAIDDLRIIHWTGPRGKEIIRGPKKIGAPTDAGSKILQHDFRGDENQYKPKELDNENTN